MTRRHLAYFLSRLTAVAAVVFISFLLTDQLGDPVSQVMAPEADLAEWQRLAAEMGRDRPLMLRFGSFILDLFKGDLGTSYRSHEPVSTLLLRGAPATMDLALCGITLALAIAVPAGVWTAAWPERWTSKLILRLSIGVGSLPMFVSALVLMNVFSVWLGLLPAFGRGETVRFQLLGWSTWDTGLGTRSGLLALALPAFAIALHQSAFLMRLIQTEMLNILQKPFIEAAHARGLAPWRIHYRHALANAWSPLVSSVSQQFGNVVMFAVVTEVVFQRPGLGLLLIRSIEHADLPVISAYLMLSCMVFIAVDIVAEVVLSMVDPRVRARVAELRSDATRSDAA